MPTPGESRAQPNALAQREEPPVEVLIVTLCEARRRTSLRRAVETTLAQQGVRASLIVVVNGERFDEQLFAALQRETGIRVCYQKEPSIFLARRLARERVTAPFFAFLDDDDYLLPGALRTRVEALVLDPTADVVVSNGFEVGRDTESLILQDIEDIRRDPLLRLMQSNWLATASALFRAESIPADFFDVTIRSMDMTYLAFRLALGKKVLFIDEPTYRKVYSPDSISLTEEWVLPALATQEKMLTFAMPRAVRRRLRRKCAATAHTIADIYRRRGHTGAAWRYHLRSLWEPWGLLRYAPYTRRLIALWVRQAIGSYDRSRSP